MAENGGVGGGGGSEKVRLSRNSKRQSRRSSRRSSFREEAEGKEFDGSGIGKRVEMDVGDVRPQTNRIQTWRSEVVDADVDLMPGLPPRPGVG